MTKHMEGLEGERRMIKKEDNNKICVDIDVNKEGVEDTIEELKEAVNIKPNITIRNNNNVYVTINYWNKEEE